jgi:NAD(P)-dependent dehydrogenase (short-subunit alcohol dehydrogenase family)
LLTDCSHLTLQAQGGEALGLVADVGKDADNKRIVDETMSKYGRLDVSFMNAGTGERVDIIEVLITFSFSSSVAVDLQSMSMYILAILVVLFSACIQSQRNDTGIKAVC